MKDVPQNPEPLARIVPEVEARADAITDPIVVKIERIEDYGFRITDRAVSLHLLYPYDSVVGRALSELVGDTAVTHHHAYALTGGRISLDGTPREDQGW